METTRYPQERPADLDLTNHLAIATCQAIERLAGASDLQGAATSVIQTYRSSLGWPYGAYWSVEGGSSLHLLCDSGHISSEFQRVAREPINLDQNCHVARALNERSLVVIPDLTSAAAQRLQIASQAGVLGCVALPIFGSGSDDAPVGVLDLYSRVPLDRHGVASMKAVGFALSHMAAKSGGNRGFSILDNAPTNLLFADQDLVVQYINPAGSSTLQRLAAYLPTTSLVGQQLTILPQLPDRRTLLDARNLPYRAEITLGPEIVTFSINGVRDSRGQSLGVLLTWEIVTERRLIENGSKTADFEIRKLIEATSAGKLSERANVEHLTGEYRSLCEGINKMLDTLTFPIYEISALLEKVGEGDLTQYLTGRYENDLLDLKKGVESTVRNLSKLATDIRIASTMINQASGEIADGISDLAKRTEEQAASLEETASSMEQMTHTVKQTAESAKSARTLAQRSREVAEGGGSVVRQAVSGMADINTASKRMADIINVIDEIAFQTNLLALNAAVEAARAGEQGRGFAVVAAEVRNLAGRSATAAKEIKALIQDSVQKVSAGTRLVEESGKNLEEIVGAVKKVSDIITEISTASQEQSAGIEEVNTAVMQMDRFTQQNAALVEKTVTAAEGLKGRAQEMRKLVDTFKILPEHADRLSMEEGRVTGRPAGGLGRSGLSSGGGKAKGKAGASVQPGGRRSFSAGATRTTNRTAKAHEEVEGFEEF